MWLLNKGLKEIDCYEINLECIERCQLIQCIKNLDTINLYRMDLENVAWSLRLGKSYDLVLCLGIVYHMENPMLFLRNVYNITNDTCIIESDTPCISPDAGCLIQQDSQVTFSKGKIRFILEQRPNRKALIDMLLAVGFSSVSIIECPADATCGYMRSSKKSVLVAKKNKV
jgi:hypothetical protein